MSLPRRVVRCRLFPVFAAAAANAQAMRVGLAEDPDVLDPTLARTFVGRIVFAAMCDKLFDVDEKLSVVPPLAHRYDWPADSTTLTTTLRPAVTSPAARNFHPAPVPSARPLRSGIPRQWRSCAAWLAIRCAVSRG